MSEQKPKSRRERMATAGAVTTVEPELSDEEKYEAELAEQARQNSGDWDSVAPGKADNFGKSFGRMIGLLKPSAVWFVFVSILGAIGVVLTVAAPKVLGEATNLVYAGFMSNQLGTAAGRLPRVPGRNPEGRGRRTTAPVRTDRLRQPGSGTAATSPSAPASTSRRCAGSSRPYWRSTSSRRC